MLLLKLTRNSAIPLHQQITDQVRGLIDGGSLPIGTALPPTRIFAEQLGVNRTTVYRAYEELWALGYIEGRPGSYSRIRGRMPLARGKTTAGEPAIHWDSCISDGGRNAYATFLRFTPEGGAKVKDAVDFSSLDMDYRFIPAELFRRCMNAVLRREGAGLLCYGPRAGYGPLREQVARRLQVHGIRATVDEILITNGSQHGLDLIIRLLADRTRGVVVEAPTYAMMLPLLRIHQTPIIPVPMQRDGMDLDALEAALTRGRAGFVYTMPNFHNPTGISTTQEHRERLLGLCEHHGVPLVEDGFEEEMKYFGKVSLPIKSMDTRGVVLYLGTFSKILMPGLRIGWVAADRDCIQRLVAVRRFTDLSPSTLLHAAAAEFCAQGLYDLHIRRLHRLYRRRMQTTLGALREWLDPSEATWSEPAGGYLIWVELNRCVQAPEAAYDHIARSGVVVSPGSYYFPEPPARPCFRLSIATVDESRIEEGIRRLARAIREVSGR